MLRCLRASAPDLRATIHNCCVLLFAPFVLAIDDYKVKLSGPEQVLRILCETHFVYFLLSLTKALLPECMGYYAMQ